MAVSLSLLSQKTISQPMRKLFYVLLVLLCSPLFSHATPGDTTWVQAQNLQLTHFGSFDAAISFPSGGTSYRKIYLVFTLGTYACGGSSQCHQWDYDVHNILMTPGGDTIELSRFITPYANTGVPRFPAGWTHRYVFDVTDYYPLLKGNAVFRLFYSGYTFGFTANVRFAFIEGTPERNVLGITKLWGGGFTYGKASDPIDSHIKAVTRTAPAGTQNTELKLLITGHGSDTNQCCEFASHNYRVKVNGNILDTQAIWRADCGLNELYPQGGTWIYDRANWCPGAIVNPNTHRLTGVSAGASYNIDLDFDPYTNTNTTYGSYNVQANAIYYGAFNKSVDASLESIIAPTNFEAHFRENPSSARPIINVRNTGGTTISTMQIVYGVKDSTPATYTWTGSLAPLTENQIILPELPSLKKMSMDGLAGTYTFTARIAGVNGAPDNDALNDSMRSNFTVAPVWPPIFIIDMRTNNEGVSALNQNPSETSWKIIDASGNIIASRTNANVKTNYLDTVELPQGGMYNLTITDLGCDGLNWWVYRVNTYLGVDSGSLTVRDWATNAILPLNGYTDKSAHFYYHDDFGCSYTQNFSTKGYPAGVRGLKPTTARLVAYPNPAQKEVKVALYTLTKIRGSMSIVDVVGRTVLSVSTSSATTSINVQTLRPGLYQIIYHDDNDGSSVSTRVSIVQ
jgi:hypothetical protein